VLPPFRSLLIAHTSKKKAPRQIPAIFAGTNAGLVFLTMTCLGYLLFMDNPADSGAPNSCSGQAERSGQLPKWVFPELYLCP
jgi:hypothetical protein